MRPFAPFGSVLASLPATSLTAADGRSYPLRSPLARWALRIIGLPHLGLRVRAAAVLGAIESLRAEPRRILDAGCGPGIYLAELWRRYPGAVMAGIDLRRDKLAQANSLLSAVQAEHLIVLGDLTNVPFTAGFDLIICSDVLEHIDDDGAVVRQLAGILAPGGRLIITVPSQSAFNSSMSETFDHKRTGYTVPQLQQMLTSGGLIPELQQGYQRAFGRLAWRWNNALLNYPWLAAITFPLVWALAQLDWCLPDCSETGGLLMIARKDR